jgi:branched-chain amino acid transport system permease protein
MDADVIVQGLTAASIYVLAGVGINVLYRPTNVFSFAQGDLMMLGAMLCAGMLFGGRMPWYAAAGATALIAGALGVLVNAVSVSPFLSRTSGVGWIISTLAVSLILEDLAGKAFGPDPRLVPPPPPLTTEAHQIGPFDISSYQAGLIGITVLIVIATEIVYRSRAGKAVLAIAEDREASLLRGINPRRLSHYSFFFAGLLAGVAGILAAPVLYASIALGPMLLLKGFETVAVGGIGSNRGAVVAGVIIGMVEAIGGALFSPAYQDATTLAVVLLILLLRPQGIATSRSIRAV